MAEKKAGGYKRSGKQLRYLFASGVLGHAAGSKGKPGKTTYSKAKSQGLKGKAPAKADYSSTRAARVAAGHKQLEKFAGKHAAQYKSRFEPAGTMDLARGGERLVGGGRAGKKQAIFIDKHGDAHSRRTRPSLVGRYGRKGSGNYATDHKSVSRADAIQRSAARAVAVSASTQRGRAFINVRDGKHLDATSAGRARLTASEFRAALRETGAKGFASPRQIKVSAARKKLADALRGYRKQGPSIVRQKLATLKTDPKYAKNLRNPFRYKQRGG